MAILEKTGIFGQAQSLTGVSPITSTNDIDLKASAFAAFRDIGVGERPLYVVCQLTTTMAGSGTFVVNLQQSANAAAGPYTSLQQLFTFTAATATGTAAAYKVCPIEPLVITQNYLSLSYVVTGTLSAGAITSFLTPDVQAYVQYKKNYTISTS